MLMQHFPIATFFSTRSAHFNTRNIYDVGNGEREREEGRVVQRDVLMSVSVRIVCCCCCCYHQWFCKWLNVCKTAQEPQHAKINRWNNAIANNTSCLFLWIGFTSMTMAIAQHIKCNYLRWTFRTWFQMPMASTCLFLHLLVAFHFFLPWTFCVAQLEYAY